MLFGYVSGQCKFTDTKNQCVLSNRYYEDKRQDKGMDGGGRQFRMTGRQMAALAIIPLVRILGMSSSEEQVHERGCHLAVSRQLILTL